VSQAFRAADGGMTSFGESRRPRSVSSISRFSPLLCNLQTHEPSWSLDAHFDAARLMRVRPIQGFNPTLDAHFAAAKRHFLGCRESSERAKKDDVGRGNALPTTIMLASLERNCSKRSSVLSIIPFSVDSLRLQATTVTFVARL
jgi:hypothetical protein